MARRVVPLLGRSSTDLAQSAETTDKQGLRKPAKCAILWVVQVVPKGGLEPPHPCGH
jgi:hypothetical protein